MSEIDTAPESKIESPEILPTKSQFDVQKYLFLYTCVDHLNNIDSVYSLLNDEARSQISSTINLFKMLLTKKNSQLDNRDLFEGNKHLVRRISFNDIVSLPNDEARSLIPSIIGHLKNAANEANNQPDNESLLERFFSAQNQAEDFFCRYAKVEDIKHIYPLLDDKNKTNRCLGVRIAASFLREEPEDDNFFSNQFAKRIVKDIQDIKDDDDLVFTKQAIHVLTLGGFGKCVKPFFTELSRTPFNNKVKKVLIEAANSISFLSTIEICRDLAGETKSNEEKQALENMIKFLEPSKENQEVVESLEDLYERINFEDYDINHKVNEYETSLLTKTFSDKTAPYLDIGCGTGRLLKSLHEQGYTDLHGIDLMSKHIETAKKAVPDAKLTAGNWYDLPYPKKHFQGVYLFGRGILHNLEIGSLERVFGEVRHVIRDDGSLLLDIPDVTKGSYASEVKRFSDEAKLKGILNFREGFVYDSPDNIHYYNRYIPTRKQIEALCELTGFDIEKVIEHEIPNSKGDMNIYYELKKDLGYKSIEDIEPERRYELWNLFNKSFIKHIPFYITPEDSPPQAKPDQTKPPSSEQSEGDL